MGGWSTIFRQTSESLQYQLDMLGRLSTQISSGVRFHKGSDAPTEAARLLQLRTMDMRGESCQENLRTVTDSLQQGAQVLQEISSVLIRARELAAQGASGTYGASQRIAISHEIDALLEQTLFLVNSRTSGQYFLGGGNSFHEPFVAERTDGVITAVRYQGGQDDLPVTVAPGVDYPAQLVGSTATRLTGRQAPEFIGPTGLAGGSGTSSVEGPQYVLVTHATTTYGGAGVAAGASSATLDTALGRRTLHVDMIAQTVSLDGGPAVSFAGAPDLGDLAVTDATGDRLYVDLTGVAGAFVGDVTVESTARLSIDGGATSVEVLPGTSADVALVDSRSERVLWVDPVSLARTGTESVRVGGTGDIFQVLIDLRDVLRNSRSLPQDQQMELLNHTVNSLDEATAAVVSHATLAGGRLQALDNLGESLTNLRNHLQDEKNAMQNVDIAQLATELARMQTLYQMTLQASSRLLSLNLMDFLR